MTVRKTGADVVVRDKITVTSRSVFTVVDIDRRDPHIVLFSVAESLVMLAVGISQEVEVIPSTFEERHFYQSVTDMDPDTAASHAVAVEAHTTRKDRP